MCMRAPSPALVITDPERQVLEVLSRSQSAAHGEVQRAKALLGAAGSIVQVEARHAATIAVLTGEKITPNGAFDVPLTKAAVLKIASPLIKS